MYIIRFDNSIFPDCQNIKLAMQKKFKWNQLCYVFLQFMFVMNWIIHKQLQRIEIQLSQ